MCITNSSIKQNHPKGNAETSVANSLTRRRFVKMAGLFAATLAGTHTLAASAATAATTGQEPPTYPQEDFDSPEALTAYMEQLNSYLETQATTVAGLPAEAVTERIAAAVVELIALAHAVRADNGLAKDVSNRLHLDQDTKLTWAGVSCDIFREIVSESERVEVRENLWGIDHVPVPKRVFDYTTGFYELAWVIDSLMGTHDDR